MEVGVLNKKACTVHFIRWSLLSLVCPNHYGIYTNQIIHRVGIAEDERHQRACSGKVTAFLIPHSRFNAGYAATSNYTTAPTWRNLNLEGAIVVCGRVEPVVEVHRIILARAGVQILTKRQSVLADRIRTL